MGARTAPALFLASGSPRRRELLSSAGIRFEIVVPEVEENSNCALTIRELTTWNATRKALHVASHRPNAVVLGADTLVAVDDKIIGKPADMAEATAIIRRLSGRVHEVCTAVFICTAGGTRATGFHVFSHVKFHELSNREIAAYLARVNPLDKAGAYAAQGHGAEIIEEIRGSYTNVVGLPMNETLRALSAFGIVPAAT